MRFFLLAFLAAFLKTARAHGYVELVTAPSQQYTGWLPFSDPYSSPAPQRIVRKVPNDGPILDLRSADLPCNVGGEDPAGMTADVNAGDNLSFKWSTWYPEHRGPFTVHMADCGGSCSNFKSSNAKWFTTDQRVFLSDGKTWYTDTFLANSNTFTTKVPSNLRAGEYLIRMQLVALHSVGAPQIYPSCSQIRVQGSGNGYPTDSDLSTTNELVEGYDKINIWAADVSISTVPVAGKPVASFITDSPPVDVAPVATEPATVNNGPGFNGPTVTQTLGGTAPLETQHFACKRDQRRVRTMENRESLPLLRALRRNIPEAHRLPSVKRHGDFHY